MKCTRQVIAHRKFTTGSLGGRREGIKQGKGKQDCRASSTRTFPGALTREGSADPGAQSLELLPSALPPHTTSRRPLSADVPPAGTGGWPRDDSTCTSPLCTHSCPHATLSTAPSSSTSGPALPLLPAQAQSYTSGFRITDVARKEGTEKECLGLDLVTLLFLITYLHLFNTTIKFSPLKHTLKKKKRERSQIKQLRF